MKNVDADVNFALSFIIQRDTGVVLYRQRDINKVNERVNCKKTIVSGEPEVCSSEAEIVSEYKLTESSKGSRKSKKWKRFRPVNNCLSKTLDFSTFGLAEKSSLYDD